MKSFKRLAATLLTVVLFLAMSTTFTSCTDDSEIIEAPTTTKIDTDEVEDPNDRGNG